MSNGCNVTLRLREGVAGTCTGPARDGGTMMSRDLKSKASGNSGSERGVYTSRTPLTLHLGIGLIGESSCPGCVGRWCEGVREKGVSRSRGR